MLDTVMRVKRNPRWRRWLRGVVCRLSVAVLGGASGCGDIFSSVSASLGGATAGARGEFRVLFINNTPHRAVFTMGTYDTLDAFAAPAFAQFGFEGDDLNLPGDSESLIGAFPCARVFSIGSSRLLTLIKGNDPDAELISEASQEGVTFFAEDEPNGEGEISEGTIPAFEARLGTDFPCGALLIARFEINDVGSEPFRVDFEVVPSESPR